MTVTELRIEELEAAIKSQRDTCWDALCDLHRDVSASIELLDSRLCERIFVVDAALSRLYALETDLKNAEDAAWLGRSNE